MSERRCPECNYTDEDARFHMDHKRCGNYPFFTQPDECECEKQKMVGYWMERHDCPGRMFCGTTPKEVSECVKNELDMHDGLAPDECSEISITAFYITEAEIEAMPDFDGW